MLAKTSSGKKWEHLTAADGAAAKSKIKPPSVDERADPSASLMQMMKQMYDDGDDDMKRTIAKAWSESRDKNQGPSPLDL
jgi:calcyclin binding protein